MKIESCPSWEVWDCDIVSQKEIDRVNRSEHLQMLLAILLHDASRKLTKWRKWDCDNEQNSMWELRPTARRTRWEAEWVLDSLIPSLIYNHWRWRPRPTMQMLELEATCRWSRITLCTMKMKMLKMHIWGIPSFQESWEIKLSWDIQLMKGRRILSETSKNVFLGIKSVIDFNLCVTAVWSWCHNPCL